MLNDTASRQAAVQSIHKGSRPYARFPVADLDRAFSVVRSDFDPFPYQSSGKALLSLMMEQNLMPKTADVDTIVAETFLSDLSRSLLTSLGHAAPRENKREELIMGRSYV